MQIISMKNVFTSNMSGQSCMYEGFCGETRFELRLYFI